MRTLHRMDPQPQVTAGYRPPPTVVLAQRLLTVAAVLLLLQTVPIIYSMWTVDAWGPQFEEDRRLLPGEAVDTVMFGDIRVMAILVFGGAILLAGRGIRRGSDWGRFFGIGLGGLIVLVCSFTDFNYLSTTDFWPDLWAVLVAYSSLAIYPLLATASVLLLMPASAAHFAPR
jgi:hypothetical protein